MISSPFVPTLREMVENITLQKAELAKNIAEGERRGKITSGRGGYYQQRVEVAIQDMYLALYRKHPWVKTAVNQIARAVLGTHFQIVPSRYVKETQANPDPDQKKVLMDLIYHPNPDETQSFLIFWGLARLKICGEVFYEVEPDGMNNPRNVYTLQGRVLVNVDPFTGEFKDPKYIQYLNRTGAMYGTPFEDEEVIHIIDPNPIGGIRGHSDMEALELSLITDIFAQQFNKNIFVNAGKRTLIFQLQKGLSHTEAERNRHEIRQHYQGAVKAHSPCLIIEGEVDIKDLQEKLQDIEFIKGREQVRQEVLSTFGVPPTKVGLEQKNVDATEADTQFSKDTIRPVVVTLQDGLNHFFATKYGITDWELKLNYVETKDERRLARLLEVIGKRGYATINEAREYLGLARLPDGDVIRVYSQKTGTFIDPLDPPEPIRPDVPAQQQPPGEGDTEAQDALRDLLDDGGSLEDIMQLLGDMFTEDELREVAPDFFTSKDVQQIGTDYAKELAEEISKIQSGVMKKFENLSKDVKLDDGIDFEFPEIQIDMFPSGSFRVSTVGALRRGYMEGQRELARKLGQKVKWSLVPKSEFKMMKSRANRIARRLQRDLFAGEPKSGRLGVKRALLRAEKEGWSMDKLRTTLERYFEESKSWKALQIARTEIMRSYYMGMARAAKKMKYGFAYIQLGAKPCSFCSAAAANLGVNKLEVILDFFAGHHPNIDCMMVVVKKAGKDTPPLKKVPEGFKPMANMWTANLGYAVDDEGWGSVALAEEHTEVWKRIGDIEKNLHYLTRFDFMEKSDIPELAKALEKLPDCLVSRGVFELINFVEFHNSLPGKMAGKYLPDARYFQLSRYRSKDWGAVWTELVGRLMHDVLNFTDREVRIDEILSSTYDDEILEHLRAKYNMIGRMTASEFAKSFRLFFESPTLLSQESPDIYDLVSRLASPMME